jgi:peroxiredoxin
MVELGELEGHRADFDKRGTQVMVVSLEGTEAAAETQKQVPHLRVVADAKRGLASAVDVIDKGAAPDGGDAAAPTTILIDQEGKVRWLFRPDRFLERLSQDDLLAAVDKHLPGK